MLGRIGQWPFLPAATRQLCRRLSHESFKSFYALRNVSFSVRRGECVGIIGMNGSGKSTLLQVITRTLQPTEGEIFTRGRAAALLELGSGFNPEFTGRENVFLSGAILGLSSVQIKARFQDIADFSEIGEFIEHPVKTYSSGMQVRLAFSVTTAIAPDILIVDEALSVGDAYFQHKCFARIRKLREQGMTLLFVSHDPGAVKSLCDRAILLDAGVMIRDDAPEAVLDYYNAIIAKHMANHTIQQTETLTGGRSTRSGNKRVVADSIELLEHGASVQTVRVGEAVTFRVRANVRHAIEGFTVGILIRDRVGNDVFGTNTHHVLGPLRCESGQKWAVDFDVPCLALGIGSYSVSVSLHTGATHVENNFDWWDRALVFHVIPGSQPHFIGCCWLPVAIRCHKTN